MTDEPSGTFEITFSTGALDVLMHCEQMVRDARLWVQSCDWVEQFGIEMGTPDAISFWEAQVAACDAMEKSLYYCTFRLIGLAAPGGGMQVYRDSESSLFWRVTYGLHGGLNWHANSYRGTRLPTGLFSLNT